MESLQMAYKRNQIKKSASLNEHYSGLTTQWKGIHLSKIFKMIPISCKQNNETIESNV